MTPIPDPVGLVESKFGITMKRVGRTEYAGPCPWCGGRDRFHVWERGNYFCRPGPGHCARSGWLDELDGIEKPTPEQRLEWRVAALERKQEEHEKRLSALEQMHNCTDHEAYHRNLTHQGHGAEYWMNEGMSAETIYRYKLGYCPSCPTAPGYASYTIPVTYQDKLYNIRHRLAKPPNGGKYRPHMAGLPVMIFNADDLHADSPRLLILEGEKKSIICSQETGIPNIATMGKQAFKPGWAGKLDRFSLVYVCYDPDATEQAIQTARLFGERGRVVVLPFKADDFFTRYGGSAADFAHYINQARPA